MGILGLPYLSPRDMELLTLANHFLDGWGNSEFPNAAFVLCFRPLGKGSRVAKQETDLVIGSWEGTKTNAQQGSIMQGIFRQDGPE